MWLGCCPLHFLARGSREAELRTRHHHVGFQPCFVHHEAQAISPEVFAYAAASQLLHYLLEQGVPSIPLCESGGDMFGLLK